MQTYETVFITRPTLTEDEEKSTVDAMLQIVTGGGGDVVANDRMGRRRLAYPILKQTDGVYVRFLYDSEAAVPKELERRMRLSDDVLRAMTVRLEPNWATAAKQQAVRDEAARIENERLERERAIEAAEAAKRAAEEPAESSVDDAPDAGVAEAPDAGTPSAEAAPVEASAPAAPEGEPAAPESGAEATTNPEDDDRPEG